MRKLVLAILLAGCMSGGDFFTGYVDGVTMTGRSDSFTDGKCFHGAGDGRCHWLSVTVDNTVNENDLDIGRGNWHGVASDGGVYDFPNVDGPDAIAAGAKGTFKLGFDVGDDVRISQLRFGAFDDVHMRANIA